jgi:hypothetical protein
MFVPLWLLILVALVLPAMGYLAGAMYLVKERQKIIQQMSEREVVELTAKAVATELKKRMAKNVPQIHRDTINN